MGGRFFRLEGIQQIERQIRSGQTPGWLIGPECQWIGEWTRMHGFAIRQRVNYVKPDECSDGLGMDELKMNKCKRNL